MRGLIATLRLYPGRPRGLYVLVNVFRDAAFMYAAARHVAAPPFGALFVPSDNRRTPVIGRTLFYLGRLDEGAVAHEMLHATIEWAARIGIKSEPDGRGYRTLGFSLAGEERPCHAQERMVNQFFERARKRRFIPGRA